MANNMKKTPQQKHLTSGGTLLRPAFDNDGAVIIQKLNGTAWHERVHCPTEEIMNRIIDTLVTNHPDHFMIDAPEK